MAIIDATLRPAWRNYWPGFLIAAVLALMAAVAALASVDPAVDIGAGILGLGALVVLAFVALKRLSWKFTIDDNRVVRHYGIVSRNQQSVRIRDLRSVELNQSFFQRLLGVGNLSFYSAGSDSAEVTFVGISDPVGWRDRIDRATDQLEGSNE